LFAQECRRAQAQGVKHHFENHDLVTERCSQLIDVTDDLRGTVERASIENGMALVYSPHTTCAVVINELDDGIADDLAEALEALAPITARYRHDEREPGHTPNGHSHVRAGLLASSSQAIPIVDGSLMLGRYQRVFLCELDSSRARKVFIQVIGE
jgi:secondary thiamine-phosphate synthase enzyme